MAKRMTDTDKWKKTFIRGLPTEYKLLWFYILDDCDHAGIWQVDIEVAQIRIGVNISEKKAIQFFSEKVIVFDKGLKWFIPDFINFQYGGLNEKNKLYNSIFQCLNKYNLMGHISPIYGVKEKEQVKEKEKEIKGGVGGFIFQPPEKYLVEEFFQRSGGTIEMAESFYNSCETVGWMHNNQPIKNWAPRANNFITNWKKNEQSYTNRASKRNPKVQLTAEVANEWLNLGRKAD